MQNTYSNILYKDQNVTRIIAAEVAVLTILTLIFGWNFPVFLLVGDFALRAFTKQTTPLSAIAETIAESTALAPKPIYAAPKKFAALLGFIFSLVILISIYYNLTTIIYLAGSILIICASLEAALNICVGCYVYSLLIAPFVNYKQPKHTGKD